MLEYERQGQGHKEDMGGREMQPGLPPVKIGKWLRRREGSVAVCVKVQPSDKVAASGQT